MRFSILLPHYKVGKMSAYAIAQLLKYRGKHEIEIIVIDNNVGDGSADYFEPFKDHFTYVPYPKDKQQSHGIAFDYALEHGYVNNEYFITIESDSFPIKVNWLDYYERLINEGYDSAGSLLKLSGGTYVHPAGAMYKKSIWEEANEYYKNVQYDYFPNMGLKEGFPCHIMIRKDKVEQVIKEPQDYMDLPSEYIGLTPEQILAKRDFYKPNCGVFHNALGKFQESVKTFGNRDTNSGREDVILDNKTPIIYRIGAEPGQGLCYWSLAMGKKVALIPTEIKWAKNRGGQQQEYTLNAAGFYHLWAGSAYLGMKNTEFNDIYEMKDAAINKFYESLPENQKIKI